MFEQNESLKSNQPSKRNNGSAAVLKGKCCLANIYIEDEESTWTYEEKVKTIESISLAVYFIKHAAAEYNVKLDILSGQNGFNAEVRYNGVIPGDMFAEPFWTEEIFNLIGHPSGNSAAQFIRERFGAEHVVFIFHINKMATSYNLTYYEGVSPMFYAERVVLFSRYSNGNPTASASIVHEILHAFGAGELYFPFDFTHERKQLANEYFPDDVMNRVDYEITSLNIGEYTAYRIGWIRKLNRKYMVFEDYE